MARLRVLDRPRLGSDHHPAQRDARCGCIPAGVTRDVASVIQWASTGLAVAAVAWAALRLPAIPSYLAVVIASQLLSPILWDHYAMLLLLPVAWLVDRGSWWAIAIIVASTVLLVDSIPVWVYPLEHWVCLLAVLAAGVSEQSGPSPRAASVAVAGPSV